MMTTPNDIFSDPNLLMRIWENERKTRDFAVKLMWENMKYFGILIGSLLTAYTALLGYITTTPIFFTTYPITIIFNSMILFPVPVVIIILAWYARNDLIQRQRRFLLVVTHLLKLEDLLGLHKDISDKLIHFKEDKYLFFEYQKNLSKCDTTEAFIELEMYKKKGTFSLMQHVYLLMMGIAVLLITLGGIVLFDPSVINIHQTTYSI